LERKAVKGQARSRRLAGSAPTPFVPWRRLQEIFTMFLQGEASRQGSRFMMEGSAIIAMGALRLQIEERLLQTEDYRALKALDRAITEVRGTGAAPRETVAPGQPNQLQQKLAEKYNSAVA
jgi:hypothetical protein